MARYLGDNWIAPILTPRNTPFFTAGEIKIQFCRDCDHAQHPPDDVCYGCQGRNLEFRSCPGTGRVESRAIVHHAIHPALKDKVPYVIAIISIDGAEGCSVQGNVIGCAPEEVRIGQAVNAVFEAVYDSVSEEQILLPQWTPAEARS